MKKFALSVFGVALILFFSGASVSAMELSMDAAGDLPSGFAKTKDGKTAFGQTATGYSPASFHRILTAYGGEFAYSEDLPMGYAKAKGDKVTFGQSPIVYDAFSMDRIIRAYGCEISADALQAGPIPGKYPKYAWLEDGKVKFSQTATAYSPDSLNKILAAYQCAGPPPMPEPAPVLDSDGDGVPDDRDACPGTPKGVKVDARGCPKPMDSDGDGVIDEKDACPRTPRGVAVNARGCSIVENLLFEFDKAVIRPQYYPDLDKVAAVLKNNPGMEVEIQGHTDSKGSDSYNQRLSERRAKAVVDYLQSKGIGDARLDYKGYGESQPVAPNDTKQGRAQNRRVEIHPER